MKEIMNPKGLHTHQINTADVIVILGTKPNTGTWHFPQQLYDCIDMAKSLYRRSIAPLIIASGGHALDFNKSATRPPFLESEKIKQLLHEAGVPDNKILTESESRDTISNLYYVKENYLIPLSAKRVVFVVADYRVPRLVFLCDKILGPGYDYQMATVTCSERPTNERALLMTAKTFLGPMKDGDHQWLKGKFFHVWPYV